MAKKFVRGVTGVDDIESFDKTLTNVNDILSDGQDTYVHTKKGKTESYYKLTDSLKSITSDNSDLITVTKDDTTNTATINPKHDAQKEQVLESTRGTVSIQKGANGTTETTKVDTNPKKVLEHDNLLTDYGISKTTSGNTTKLGLEYSRVNDGFDLNNLSDGNVRSGNFVNGPTANSWYYVNSFSGGGLIFQQAATITSDNKYISFERHNKNNVWTSWVEKPSDKSVIDTLINQKQNTLASNASIGVLSNNELRQLFYYKKTYSVPEGILKTNIKSLSQNTNITVQQDEFNFSLRVNQGQSQAVFKLEETDNRCFQSIIGSSNKANISGCILTLSNSNLTVSTTNNANQNYVITFSDII